MRPAKAEPLEHEKIKKRTIVAPLPLREKASFSGTPHPAELLRVVVASFYGPWALD